MSSSDRPIAYAMTLKSEPLLLAQRRSEQAQHAIVIAEQHVRTHRARLEDSLRWGDVAGARILRSYLSIAEVQLVHAREIAALYARVANGEDVDG